MLPWAPPPATAATTSPASSAPLLRAMPRRARSQRLPPPPHHPSPPPPPLLSVGPGAAPRAARPSHGDVFWEEPDDGGSGSDDEDGDGAEAEAERQEATGRRSSFSSFPSPSLFSRLGAARRQEQREEEELRGGIGSSAACARQIKFSFFIFQFLDQLN